MILVGQYDSPFVRRVAIALGHYGLAFERRVLSTFRDFDVMFGIRRKREKGRKRGRRD